MLVEIIPVRVDPDFAQQLNWAESSLPPDRRYANSLQNARDLPASQQNRADYIWPGNPNRLFRSKVVEPNVEPVRFLIVVCSSHGQDVMVGANQGEESKLWPKLPIEA